MKRLLTTLVIFSVCTLGLYSEPGAGPQVEPPDISGIYEVQGRDAEKGYSGIAIIRKVHSGYRIQWTPGIGSNAVGFGTLEKGKLTTSWTVGPVLGQTIYTLSNDNKTLSGKWMAFQEMEWYDETLTFIKTWPKAKEVGDS